MPKYVRSPALNPPKTRTKESIMWWTLFMIHRAHALAALFLCAFCTVMVSLGRLLFLPMPFEGAEKGVLVIGIIVMFGCITLLGRMRNGSVARSHLAIVGHVSAIWSSLPAFPPIERVIAGPDMWKVDYGKNHPYIAPGDEHKIEAYAVGMAAMIATEEALLGGPSIASRQGLQEIRLLERMAGKPLLGQSLKKARTIIGPIKDQVRTLAERLGSEGSIDRSDLERILGPRKDIWDLAAKKNV